MASRGSDLNIKIGKNTQVGFVPASKMRLRRGLGYPTQITVPFVFTVCNPTLQNNFLQFQIS